MLDPDDTPTAEEQDPEAGLFLNLYSPVRAYEPQDLEQIFRDMHQEMKPKETAAHNWRIVAAQTGSHVPRLVHPRFPVSSITFPPRHGNRPRPAAYSGNGALSKFAKVLHRPILIVGDGEAASLYRRITEGLTYSGALQQAFGAVFGQEALDGILAGLADTPDTSQIAGTHGTTFFNGENFPIVILPGPDGQDVQTTPIPSIESHTAPHEEYNRRWECLKKANIERDAWIRENPHAEKLAVAYQIGTWIATDFSGKPQNASPNARKARRRLLVVLPEFGEADSRRIWAWAQRKDGAFMPAPRSDYLRRLVIAWDTLSQRALGADAAEGRVYTNQRMRHATTAMITEIGRLAQDHIASILEMARDYVADPDELPPPPPVHVLLGRLRFEAADFPDLPPKEAFSEGRRIAQRLAQDSSIRHLLNEEH